MKCDEADTYHPKDSLEFHDIQAGNLPSWFIRIQILRYFTLAKRKILSHICPVPDYMYRLSAPIQGARTPVRAITRHHPPMHFFSTSANLVVLPSFACRSGHRRLCNTTLSFLCRLAHDVLPSNNVVALTYQLSPSNVKVMSQDDTPTTARVPFLTISPSHRMPFLASRIVIVQEISRLDCHVDYIRIIELEGKIYPLESATEHLHSTTSQIAQLDSPFKAHLSSTNLPSIIKRILLGLAGRGSHSLRQSVHISSFNLYPLISLGSNVPSVDSTSTFLFVRYFSSIL